MKNFSLALLAGTLAALAAASDQTADQAVPDGAATQRIDGTTLAWSLPPTARIEGERLIVEVPKGDPERTVEAHAQCTALLDLSPYLAGGRGLHLSVRVRASDVTKPDYRWNGVKCMFRYISDATGQLAHPGAALPIGSFDWRTADLHLNFLNTHGLPVDGKATLVLGLQGCSGRAEFDLASLSIVSEDVGVPFAEYRDYVVEYPEGEGPDDPGRRRWRGFMSPGRDMTEDDIETLHQWGATLVRFQINRNWWKLDDNQDLDEYARWVDRRLDNLMDVLRWCEARGMKVCIDLHALPGGKWGEREREPLEMNMFSDDRYAAAFVDTWRRIATRCAPVVQTTGPVIYGYDLVNEPSQRRPLRHSFWQIQLDAARAIREIDPVTPIVFAGNNASHADDFRYLVPIPLDNVIYQVHCYHPHSFTHQGVSGNAFSTAEHPITWPGVDPRTGEVWNKDWLRKKLQPVRDFQLRHKARIFVGEFSAAAWAQGAENYLRDCIDLFEEYGWDWTYHAFREAPCWDVEKILPEGIEPSTSNSKLLVDAPADTPRKRALLDGLSR